MRSYAIGAYACSTSPTSRKTPAGPVWSPGRLSLATPTPDLFTPDPVDVALSAAEAAAVARDGVIEERDTRGDVYCGDSTEKVLALYLYKGQAVAYCCARAGLRLTDARAITGPPDIWVRLSARDYWS
ncbi:hypothetical protein Aple_072890 [Acrocarpospora pleiomorpha]|uniref:Uncharacterized protein n=1 Tax=Acrocarpospora pleiomorpha TaxID=90975 RepID=A0A5M3XU34_9ACTN|nr:hypothetical protein [Acrocarpospora pleiomorpha]GES24390.1 hypothetical protein Aple_072890 [Acrocarpospora pleiomorpha]